MNIWEGQAKELLELDKTLTVHSHFTAENWISF